MDVIAWLRRHGFEQYEQAFRDNDIDAEVLPELTAEDLSAIGVTSVGHRRKLLAAIAALGDDADPTSGLHGRERATPSLPEGERREVTVLFADLAGYTKLTDELDAEEIHALLDRFFGLVDDIVESYGGTIDKHIGDCAMAVFGAPVAHGNDPERAVCAALAIQRRMPALAEELGRTIGAHIGIASGQVVASGTGSDRRREYTVTGESVNLASRLTDEAASGAILVSDTVQRALASRLDCTGVGELTVKGLAQPVTAWRVHGVGEAAADRRPFIGRRGEIHQFRAALAACGETGRGHTIYVRGEAGIGKTRLVEEFLRLAREAGAACHAGLVLDFGAGVARDAIRAVVRSILGLGTASGGDATRAAAARALSDELVPADEAVFLNDLLDLPQPTELRALYDAMDNAARNRGKRETVAGLVERVSRGQPQFLVVEDVHWADGPVLDHLARLTEAVAECPTLLVITSRVEGDPLDRGWRGRTGGAPLTTIDLGPLHRDEARELAAAFSAANATLAERYIERAAGNPLFLEQLLQHAEESTDSVPGSVRSLAQARLDQLDMADKAALQAASVLGQRFGRDVLAHLLGDPGYAPERLTAHLLVRPEGETFLFAHALIRDAIYDTLLKSRRRALHRRAADWFANRDLILHAEHLERAEAAEAPRAYLAAARAQADGYRYDLARRLVERGLAVATAPADRFALACFHGEILHDLGEMATAGNAYDAALAAAEDDAERCRAWVGRAAVKRVTDDLEGAFADLEHAEAAAAAHGLIAEQARIHLLRGNLYFPRGEVEECLRQHELALGLAEQANAPEMKARALGGLGDAEYARGRMASAYKAFSRCVALCREHGFGRIEVANLSMVAHTQVYLNDVQGALESSHAAVELASRVGHPRAEVIAHNAACNVFRTTSDFGRATAHAERTLTLARRLGARRFEAQSLDDHAMIRQAEGRRTEALELVNRALAISRETGLSFLGPWILGHLAVSTDDPQTRREALIEAEEILKRGAVSHNYFWFYRYAIEASLNAGEWDAAERYAAALEVYTRPEPLPWAEFVIACGRALAAYGRGRRGATLSEELKRLSDEGERLGYKTALPAIAAALRGE